MLALYVAYGVLGIAGLVLSIRQEWPVFVQLVPAVSNTIHLIALSSAGLFISDWNPYPVDPKRLYLLVDFFMAAFGCMSFYLLSTDDRSSDSYFHIAIVSNLTVLLGTVLCVRKSIMPLDLKNDPSQSVPLLWLSDHKQEKNLHSNVLKYDCYLFPSSLVLKHE